MCNLDTLNDNNTHGRVVFTSKILFPISYDEKIPSRNPRQSVNAVSDKYTRVESGKATARIESDGYKKKLLASQTHLDLQTILARSRSLSPFPYLVSILLSFLRDTLSPFLCTHSLFYIGFIFYLFLLFPRLLRLFPDSAAPHS